jgi:hypothetical protein
MEQLFPVTAPVKVIVPSDATPTDAAAMAIATAATGARARRKFMQPGRACIPGEYRHHHAYCKSILQAAQMRAASVTGNSR